MVNIFLGSKNTQLNSEMTKWQDLKDKENFWKYLQKRIGPF